MMYQNIPISTRTSFKNINKISAKLQQGQMYYNAPISVTTNSASIVGSNLIKVAY